MGDQSITPFMTRLSTNWFMSCRRTLIEPSILTDASDLDLIRPSIFLTDKWRKQPASVLVNINGGLVRISVSVRSIALGISPMQESCALSRNEGRTRCFGRLSYLDEQVLVWDRNRRFVFDLKILEEQYGCFIEVHAFVSLCDGVSGESNFNIAQPIDHLA